MDGLRRRRKAPLIEAQTKEMASTEDEKAPLIEAQTKEMASTEDEGVLIISAEKARHMSATGLLKGINARIRAATEKGATTAPLDFPYDTKALLMRLVEAGYKTKCEWGRLYITW